MSCVCKRNKKENKNKERKKKLQNLRPPINNSTSQQILSL